MQLCQCICNWPSVHSINIRYTSNIYIRTLGYIKTVRKYVSIHIYSHSHCLTNILVHYRFYYENYISSSNIDRSREAMSDGAGARPLARYSHFCTSISVSDSVGTSVQGFLYNMDCLLFRRKWRTQQGIFLTSRIIYFIYRIKIHWNNDNDSMVLKYRIHISYILHYKIALTQGTYNIT